MQKASQAIEKFIDLFEQIKSFREKTVETPESKYKVTENIDEKNGYSVPINMMYQAPPQMPALNPYGVKASLCSSPIKQSPIINPFVQQGNDHELQPQIAQKQNIIKKTPPQGAPLITRNQLSPAPIVIQTDQNEIPPLVITLSQPSPMNRNIVVSTEFPYFMNKSDRQRWQYMTHYGRNPDTKEDIVNRKEMLNSYSNLDYTKRTREVENPKHSGLSGKFEDWEVMFHSHKNDSEKMNTGAKPNVLNYPYNIPRNLERNGGHPRDHNIRGYHERLESLGQWPQEHKFEHREENTESKVTSRQQIPINMKVGSKYDDTHFRNFLMTQQKVNDMLESILAANVRPDDGPRSVESI